MAYEQKDGQGSLFKNEEKEAEQQPDYTGTITITGTQYRLAAWIKSSKGGKKFMSLNAQLPRQQANPVSRDVPPATVDFDDDLPFN